MIYHVLLYFALAVAVFAPVVTFHITSLLGSYPSAIRFGRANSTSRSVASTCLAPMNIIMIIKFNKLLLYLPVETGHSGSRNGPSSLTLGLAKVSILLEVTYFFAASETIVCTYTACMYVCVCV